MPCHVETFCPLVGVTIYCETYGEACMAELLEEHYVHCEGNDIYGKFVVIWIYCDEGYVPMREVYDEFGDLVECSEFW